MPHKHNMTDPACKEHARIQRCWNAKLQYSSETQSQITKYSFKRTTSSMQLMPCRKQNLILIQIVPVCPWLHFVLNSVWKNGGSVGTLTTTCLGKKWGKQSCIVRRHAKRTALSQEKQGTSYVFGVTASDNAYYTLWLCYLFHLYLFHRKVITKTW